MFISVVSFLILTLCGWIIFHEVFPKTTVSPAAAQVYPLYGNIGLGLRKAKWL
jgi:hypothetical protein